jgi:repressor LexA
MQTFDTTAARLKECREKKGETLDDIGRLVGVNKTTVMRWERGDTSKINIPTLQFLADHFHVSLGWLSGQEDTFPLSPAAFPYQRGVLLPIMGTVRAGIGGEVQEEIIGEEAIDSTALQTGEQYFWLRVAGDSMTPSINDGDLVLVRRQSQVENGQYAVILVNSEEGLVKRVTYGADWIELHSVNPYYPPRRFEGPQVNEVRILGRVMESRRKFA